MELWKPLNQEGLYWVSSYGRVKVAPRKTKDGRKYPEKFVDCSTSKRDGYVRFNFIRGGKRHCATLHRAVAELFVPNTLDKPEVNHKDGNKQNNRANNLEWVTPSENQRHALATGLRKLNSPAQSKKVGMFSLDGELLRVFPSVAEAHRQTNYSINILYKRCAAGYAEAFGHLWRYIR